MTIFGSFGGEAEPKKPNHLSEDEKKLKKLEVLDARARKLGDIEHAADMSLLKTLNMSKNDGLDPLVVHRDLIRSHLKHQDEVRAWLGLTTLLGAKNRSIGNYQFEV